MPIILYAFVIIAAAIFYIRKDLRRQMIWAGLYSLPLLLIVPITSHNFLAIAEQNGGVWLFLLQRIILSFSFGAVAAALYEGLLQRHFTPSPHPQRRHFLWLTTGIFVFFLAHWVLHLSFILSIILSLGIDIIFVLAFRRDLLTDLLFSGLGMGVLYLVIFTVVNPTVPGDFANFWFSEQITGLTVLSIPIEELIAVFLFGALWGPLYVAVKGLRETDLTPSPQRFRLKVVVVYSALLILLIFTLWMIDQFLLVPRVRAQDLADQSIGLSDPITINFTRPINRSRLAVAISPRVDNDISFGNSIASSHLFRSLTIDPSGGFLPDTDYTVTLTSISNSLGNGNESYIYRFHTLSLPRIVQSSLESTKDAADPCEPIIITLDQDPTKTVSYDFSLEPETKLTAEFNAKLKQYSLTSIDCLTQNTNYTLRAKPSLIIPGVSGAAADSLKIFEQTFHTKSAPGISSMTPQGSGIAVTTDSIVITFDQSMETLNPENRPTISPAIDGAWHWDGDTKLLFKRSGANLNYATEYKITLPKGIQSKQKTQTDADIILKFTTIGPVSVSHIAPNNNASNVSTTSSISFTFDQTVDHASAESLFTITPAIPGSFSWNSSVLTYKTQNPLDKNTTYKAMLASGVKSTIGLPSTKSFTTTFMTEETTKLLSITLDYQDKALSCEAAALKMALAGKGLSVSEDQIMNIVGYDPTIRSGNIWGDPNVAFVGSINGKQNTTGYGVQWDPIARAARALGRSTDAFSGWSVQNLAEAINNGNPVIIWGTLGNASPDAWTTPGGKQISAWKGEHARTVIGFKGSTSNPTQFIINDPIAGRITWSTSKLKANWSVFNNSGVAVY